MPACLPKQWYKNPPKSVRLGPLFLTPGLTLAGVCRGLLCVACRR